MKALYKVAAASFGGALIAYVPVSAFAATDAVGYHARYYYLSMSSIPRQIDSTGFMKFINTADGQKILYTHSNITGHKPTADAEIVHFAFAGKAPVETWPMVNKAAYTAYIQQVGKPVPAPLTATVTFKSPPAKTNTASSKAASSTTGTTPKHKPLSGPQLG